MGDALSADVPFEFLHQEIIGNVNSEAGQRHLWLWLTKRPTRMAEFGEWLGERGADWPANLAAMTTITGECTAKRAAAVLRVPAKIRGLSCEPLVGPTEPDLDGIDWVIAGGGSDVLTRPFEVEWALDLRAQCHRSGASFFLKQLGRVPWYQGERLKLTDRHGGDWSEWQAEWRVRQVPPAFATYPGVA